MITIIYRDELGLIEEAVDMYGIEFLEGQAIFNDQKINIENIVSIKYTFGKE